MKIAHVVIVTPNRCGLYETTRECVAAERALGADARMYDPAPTQFHPKEDEDRGALIVRDKEWLKEADVIFDHSGCDGTTDKLETPHVLVAHGRPRHSFLSEVSGGPPIYSYHYRLDRTPKYKAAVTFWNEHVAYLQATFKAKPVYAVPAPVDLQAWSNTGPTGYKFHDKAGAYNAVIADSWRDDADPYHCLHTAILVGRMLPGFRVHIYGKTEGGKGWDVLLGTLQQEGTLGEVCGWVSGLGNVYRAADLVLSCNDIATRTVREAMACGCPAYTPKPGLLTLSAKEIVRQLTRAVVGRNDIRRQAEQKFNPRNTAKALLGVATKAVTA